MAPVEPAGLLPDEVNKNGRIYPSRPLEHSCLIASNAIAWPCAWPSCPNGVDGSTYTVWAHGKPIASYERIMRVVGDQMWFEWREVKAH